MATRRTVSARHERSRKPPTISAEKLAEELSAKLAISNRKEEQEAPTTISDEEARLSVMRSINSASQGLSVIVQSGWKRSSDVPVSKRGLKDVITLTAVVKKGLADLRQMSSREVDVERAALSVLGKLVALEMFDEAVAALEDLHSRLYYLHNFSIPHLIPRNRLHLVSLPIPSPGGPPTDPTLLTLTTTYLAYALSVLSTTCSTPARNSSDGHPSIVDFSTILDTEPTLLTWIPSLSSLPGKQVDSALTRVYTALVRSCATCTNNPQAVFTIRNYALRCLAHTTTGLVEPSHLWDQATRFGGAFIKSQCLSDKEATTRVLSAYGEIVDKVESRPDRSTFMSGKSFVRFSEYWLAFAEKAGNMSTLDRISGLVSGNTLQSDPPSTSPKEKCASQEHVQGVQAQHLESLMQEGYHICASLAQTTVALEQGEPNSVQRVRELTNLLEKSRPFIGTLKANSVSEDESKRINEKLDRALVRMRRTAMAFLESPQTASIDNCVVTVRLLVEEILQIWSLPGGPVSGPDNITRSLETLFCLARIVLSPTDPRSYSNSHKYLAQAVTIVETSKQDVLIDAANLVRCISGAFYNIAGTLYQAGRHGAAIAFLQDACSLGTKALSTPRTATLNNANEKTEEGWRQLDEQLYRRWELLGICYTKIGDRKRAFEALHKCLASFPYSKSRFHERAEKHPLTTLFDMSNDTKQLGILVDKFTYLATCELLLGPDLVSLASLKVETPAITGVLLERQLESLEPYRRREGVRGVITRILGDALNTYMEDMPIRRARVLLKCMDFAYHADIEAFPNISPPEGIVLEIGKILDPEEFGKDDQLAQFRFQYRASAHLWLVLHAHRRADREQSRLIKLHSDAACKILKGIAGASDRKPGRKHSPKHVLPSKKTLPPPSSRLRSRRVALSQKIEPATPKPKLRKDQNLFLPKTPPRSIGPAMIACFDDFEALLTLLQLTARITGLLSLTTSKVHILGIMRKLCDQQLGATSNGYVMTSIDMAHEYVKFGKVRRAAAVFNQILVPIRSGKVSDEACILYFLRFAELLALTENAENSIAIYCEALALSKNVEVEDKSMTVTQRVHTRVRHLERAAIASRVYSLIQYLKEDASMHLDGTLQSLRLWNRAFDSLTRLNLPPATPSNHTTESNPFEVASTKGSGRSPDDLSKETFTTSRTFTRWPSLGALEWRVADGLLDTLFSLSRLYFFRGSPREAEYFAEQARNLAESLNAPAMVSRALVKIGEVQLYQGSLDKSFETLTKTYNETSDNLDFDSADICRLRGVYDERTSQRASALELYQKTIDIIKTLDQTFDLLDNMAFGGPPDKITNDVVLPDLLAVVLRQKIWLLRDHDIEDYTPLLDRFLSLPNSTRTKTEENALIAKLNLHAVYGRLHSDMFLCSMAESTIALPMGMSSKLEHVSSLPVHDILTILDKAAQLYWANLSLVAHRGSVHEVRETITSLALVQAFQTALGRTENGSSYLAAGLLDASAAITLRRDMLATSHHKFPARIEDDLHWPVPEVKGQQQPGPQTQTIHVSSEDEPYSETTFLKECWNSIQNRYRDHTVDFSRSISQMTGLPSNWTIINISTTEDKNMLFVARQEGGESHREPLIFCIPLRGRRDNGNGEDDDENLTFDDVMEEFRNIVRLSDEGTKVAIHIKEDQGARATWWKQRGELNTRMRELLENIEYCWLGAFKTILSPRPYLTSELISDLRVQFEKVFQRNLHVKDKKSKSRPEKHKKSSSQAQNQAPSQVTFDDSLLECFSTLSPKCRDEELEDLVYFILDLYQFHGVPVAIAEVDIVQVVVDLRSVLEDHTLRLSRREPHRQGGPSISDEHIFLVLDKNLQCLPWESIPILRGRSISRIPSIDFLHDRLSLAKSKSKSIAQHDLLEDRVAVDPRKGYYILNPSGDLHRTEGRFKTWAAEMQDAGWEGIIGCAPSEQQFLYALQNQDLVVYFGHGGGEQYVRSHKIRTLPSCAATMLWGCSSGALRDMGDFDPTGTPYNYMIAGCPTLVANLWDVTDRDIDLFSKSVFDKLHLTAKGIRKWATGQQKGDVSIVEAVAQSRDTCKLEYLTGAAPVVYGIPFYL